ncbi:small RNA degrading nuclease 5 isoform X3 [Diprion similis]|uniref:small RNA degrading nuclease 5 isoform X3 n=1 Tax=Diprion similis TaxID=362088 RepID=UPI001EF905B6|nr:small RNA degrading nuclease 5 isoform X3 [Diprion similis]
MKTPTGKQLQRIEKKRKKMAALLEITKLNDRDREAKALALKQAVGGTNSELTQEETLMNLSSDQGTNSEASSSESPSRKRPCTRTLDAAAQESTDSEPLTTEVENNEEPDPLANKKPRLSGEEYAKLKQELKERKQRLKVIPRFRLKNVGENASLNVDVKDEDRIPIFLSDVQHLLMYSLLGHHSPYLPARWCLLEKYNKVAHTVVLVVEGLSLYHFNAYESMFTNITTNMAHRLEVVTPTAYGGSIIEDLAAVPLTGTQSDRLIKQFGSMEAALQSTGDLVKLLKTVFPMRAADKLGVGDKSFELHPNLPVTDKFPRTQLLLSPWQLVEENYPLPLKGELARKYEKYILTKDMYVEATPRSPMFGLDCEMCRTTTGFLELTRISIVDERMNIIYETLVKPENEITDYLTRYSGITKEILRNVTTTLVEVQNALREILPPDAILVGQSLNSDLHTLKMMHPYIIDTSVIYNITGDRYRKTKLQTLAREFLNERIQEGRGGHCPSEDSKASLKLAQLKLANSLDFGDAVLVGQKNMEILKMGAEKRKSLKVIDRMELRNYATSIFNHVTKDKKTAAIVGTEDVMNEYSRYLKNSSLSIMDDQNFDTTDQVRLVVAESNKHAVSRASNVLMEHAFTLCHLRITEDQLKNENIEKTFRTVNKWVQKLWQHTAIHGLGCVVFGGQNNAANGACFLDIKKDVTVIGP